MIFAPAPGTPGISVPHLLPASGDAVSAESNPGERTLTPVPDPRRPAEDADIYEQLHASPEFADLRRRFRRLVFPLTAAFLTWYFAYVLLATYRKEFMAREVFGHVNVGLLFGLGQFVSTFGIAWWYAHRAERDLDPAAEQLQARFGALSAGRTAEGPQGLEGAQR